MLQRLFIQNYAIIQRQEITFTAGLNIITGETGAGKSILLGALGLVLGQRADTKVLFDPSVKGIIEAVFTDYPDALRHILAAEALDIEENVIMRREISPSGKSRAFVNDTPVRLEVMQRVSAALIDLHQQFESLEIQESAMQYDLLDAFAGHQPAMEEYQNRYWKLTAVRKEHAELTTRKSDALKEQDYLQFQLDELEAANLSEGLIEELEDAYDLQESGTQIQTALHQASEYLAHGETPVLDILRELSHSLQPFSEKSTALGSIVERLRSIELEIEDLGTEMATQAGQMEIDPKRQAELEEQLDVLRRLLIKHNVRTTGELLEVRDTFQSQMDSFEELDTQIAKLEAEQEVLHQDLLQRATEISAGRKKYARTFMETINAMLGELEMKNARLDVVVEPSETLHGLGKDHVEFLFTSNLGAEKRPIKKVASGGELSRLSLCIKSAVSQKMQLPSLVFDEIDAGVSGQVALKMGLRLQDLAKEHQVIMITHSPQIASRARHHLRVSKRDLEKRSIAEVSVLDEGARIREIAKMLSGDPPTDAALLNAKELINV